MNAMRNSWIGLLLLGWVLVLQSCGPKGPPPEEMIAKSWRLKTLNIQNQPPPPPEIMGTSSFNFHKNGRYEILMGELERGTWRLSDDKKVLITVPEGAVLEQQIDIIRLTETELHLSNHTGVNVVEMELVPQ